MDIDDAALRAWVPGLAPAVAGLPADRRTWRINRSGVRGLLAASSAGLTWSEQGGLVTRPFTDVASLELVGVNGVVLHVHGLLPARLTFPDVRDRDAFEQVLHAQRAAGHGPVAAAAPAPPTLPPTLPTEQLAPMPLAPVVPVAPVTPAPMPVAAAPVAAAPVAARGRSGPSPFGPPTARAVAPPVPPVAPAPEVPVAPAWPTTASYPVPTPTPPTPPARSSSHPPSSSRLRAARLAEERRAGTVPGPTAPEAPQLAQRAQHAQHPQHPQGAAAAPSGDLVATRLRDGLLVAGFLAGVGALLAFFSSQAASQSVQSTGSHVLTYVGIGLVVLGIATALFTAGRALGGSQR